MELVAGRPAPSDLLSDSAVSVVANAIEAPGRTLGEVALLPMDEGVRMLAVHGSQGAS